MKKMFVSLVIILCSLHGLGQKYYTKSGNISFFSGTSVEDIEAINRSVVALLDSRTGDVHFVVLMKSFAFKKALMQEHFNEDYIESDKFPKAEFKGKITNNAEIKYNVDGTYTAKVSGQLTIHGQTRTIETTGTIVIKSGKVQVNSIFNVLVADYKITVPKLYRDNISPSIRVTVNCTLGPLK